MTKLVEHLFNIILMTWHIKKIMLRAQKRLTKNIFPYDKLIWLSTVFACMFYYFATKKKPFMLFFICVRVHNGYVNIFLLIFFSIENHLMLFFIYWQSYKNPPTHTYMNNFTSLKINRLIFYEYYRYSQFHRHVYMFHPRLSKQRQRD